MAATLLRFLALIAVMLMPFGMAAAPAAAHPAPVVTGEHCADHQQAPAKQAIDCTLVCAALPATENPEHLAPSVPQGPRAIAFVDSFNGIDPEIATPPPKHS
jgi:hypothetical protein